MQLNIPEGFLNPVEDKRAKSTEEERREKVRKTVLPIPNAPCLAHEPRNGPTRILAAAVWLKMSHKYFNEGTAKEACEWFDVRAKQLSRVLTGRKYLGLQHASKKNVRPLKSRSEERRQTVRYDTTQHNTYYIISSVHMAKNNHKSVPAQIITSPHFIKSSALVPVQVAQSGIH